MEGPSTNARPTTELSELLRHFAELLRSSPHNLLSPRGLQELEERHFPEAVAFSRGLPAGPRVLDVGSGGGLPGMVIAMTRPDLAVELLEATGKKAEFLTEAAGRLGLPVAVHHGRAEDLATAQLAGAFDLVTARAVAPLQRLGPWTAPFLRRGGQLHAIKGERWSEELTAARPTLDRLGLVVRAIPSGGRPEGEAGGPRVVVLERTR